MSTTPSCLHCGHPRPPGDFSSDCTACGGPATQIGQIQAGSLQDRPIGAAEQQTTTITLAQLGPILDQAMSTVIASFEQLLFDRMRSVNRDMAALRQKIRTLTAELRRWQKGGLK